MRALEAFSTSARFIQDADQIHHDIHALELTLEYDRVVHIGLNDLGGGQYQQLAVTLAMAGKDSHLMAGHGQTFAQAAPDETSPAQYSDA